MMSVLHTAVEVLSWITGIVALILGCIIGFGRKWFDEWIAARVKKGFERDLEAYKNDLQKQLEERKNQLAQELEGYKLELDIKRAVALRARERKLIALELISSKLGAAMTEVSVQHALQPTYRKANLDFIRTVNGLMSESFSAMGAAELYLTASAIKLPVTTFTVELVNIYDRIDDPNAVEALRQKWGQLNAELQSYVTQLGAI